MRRRLMAADPGGTGTGSRPLYEDVADPGSIGPFGAEIEPANPSGWPGYEGQLEAARTAPGARHAVTTGRVTVAGEPCVIVGFDFLFLGGSAGIAEGSRIARALSVAAAERLPVVCVAASGGSRMQEGTIALVQMQVYAAAIAAGRHPVYRGDGRSDHRRRMVVSHRGRGPAHRRAGSKGELLRLPHPAARR